MTPIPESEIDAARRQLQEQFRKQAIQPPTVAPDSEAQNISALERWASENPVLLEKIQTPGASFNPVEQAVAVRWMGEDSDLLNSLIPTDEAPEPKASLIEWVLIAGGSLLVVGIAIAFLTGFTTANKPKPLENVASKNVEVSPSYVPTDEALKEVVRPTPTPNPLPEPSLFNPHTVLGSEDTCLNIRTSPNGAETGTCVSTGDRVSVLNVQGDWTLIQYQGVTGWAFTRYLTSSRMN